MNTNGHIAAESGRPYAVAMSGTVLPPADMVDAARKSLCARCFADLMHQTGQEPPTPAQLVAMAEQERIQGCSVTLHT